MVRVSNDLKQSLRGVLRAPRLPGSAVLCLGVGIGATATMLGALDQLLFRPLAGVTDTASVRRIYFHEEKGTLGQSVASYPMIADLTGRVEAFSEVGAFFPSTRSLGVGLDARQVRAGFATPSFFRLLGVQPVCGRLLTEAEGDPMRFVPVALISWELWQNTLGGTPDVLGLQLRVQRRLYTVVGVLPRGFTGVELDPVDVWLPVGAASDLWGGPGWVHNRTQSFLQAIARLRSGVSVDQASQQATAIHQEAYLSLHQRGATDRSISLGPVQAGWAPYGAGSTRVALWVTCTAGAVLLLACLNVANLLILRGVSRRRELAVRLALGASRFGVARLLLLEALVLAFLGGIAAWAASRAFGLLARAFLLPAGADLPGALDPRWLVLLTVLCLTAGLASGLGPAFTESRYDLATTLNSTLSDLPLRQAGRGFGSLSSIVGVDRGLALAMPSVDLPHQLLGI